jgi:hypothetical protein
VAQVWLQDGENTWPIDLNTVAHLFMDQYWRELQRHIVALRERGTPEPQIAGYLDTAARVIRLSMPCVLGMKRAGLPPAQQQGGLLELLNLAALLKHGDLFNREGVNRVWSPDQCRRYLDSAKFQSANPPLSRLLHRLCATLWNYAEAVYFKVHGVVRDFHGPYGAPGIDGDVLVRDFAALDVGALWEDCVAVPYNHVRVAAVYRQTNMSIDFYGNVAIAESASYVSSLSHWFVEGDGQLLTEEEIRRLCLRLGEGIISVTGTVETMDWRRLTGKYAAIFWHAKRDLAKAAGHPAQAPQEVMDRINGGQRDSRISSLGRAAMLRLLRVAL